MNKHTAFEQWERQVRVEELAQIGSLSEMEQKLRQILQVVGNVLLHLWIMWMVPSYNAPTLKCVYCGGEAQYTRHRKGTRHTMFGEIRYRRAYYLCASCQQGHYPVDEQLGLRPNAFSAEVERLASLLGVQMPFG